MQKHLRKKTEYFSKMKLPPRILPGLLAVLLLLCLGSAASMPRVRIAPLPDRVVAAQGKTASVTVKTDAADGLDYLWSYAEPGEEVFRETAVTDATYTVTMNGTWNGRRVRCAVKDRFGKTVTSEEVTLCMAAPITVLEQPVSAQALQGEVARIYAKAEGEGTLSYQWYICNGESGEFVKSEVTGPLYSVSMSEAADGRRVFCTVSDAYGQKLDTETAVLSLIEVPEEPHVHAFEEIPLGKGENGYAFLKTCTGCGAQETVCYDALLTFVDDDGKTQAVLHWERIMDATGIRMTAALIGSQLGPETDYDTWWSYAGWDLLEQLQAKGMDFVNHTYNHKKLPTFTEAELHQDFQDAKNALEAYGIQSRILVYPFNKHNALVESVASEYFDAAFCGKDLVITGEVMHNYALTRVNINDPEKTKTITFEDGRTAVCEGVKSLEKLQADLQGALDCGGWLVCLSHAYDSPSGEYYFDEESEQTIIEFCRYTQGLGNVKIVTLTEGLAAAQPLPETPEE